MPTWMWQITDNLRDDGHMVPKSVKIYRRSRKTIVVNLSFDGYASEKRQRKRALPATSLTDNADVLARLHVEGDIV